jgi:transcriptional regulator with XRE-family HTH domain
MYNIPKGSVASKVLKDIRTKELGAKYSQTKFADKIGCSRITISNVERGESPLTKGILASISEAFNKPIEELISSDIRERLENPFTFKGTVSTPESTSVKEERAEHISSKPRKDSNLIDSLQKRILDLEDDNKRLINERERLMTIIDNLSKGVAHH